MSAIEIVLSLPEAGMFGSPSWRWVMVAYGAFWQLNFVPVPDRGVLYSPSMKGASHETSGRICDLAVKRQATWGMSAEAPFYLTTDKVCGADLVRLECCAAHDRRLAVESMMPAVKVADIARKHGATRWQIYDSCNQLRKGKTGFA